MIDGSHTGAATGMPTSSEERRPGDETAPGTPQSAEDLCRNCGGTGRAGSAGEQCPACAGMGQVTATVVDA